MAGAVKGVKIRSDAISPGVPESVQHPGSLGEVGDVGGGRRRASAGPLRGKSLFLIKRKLPFSLCENDIFQSMDLFTRLESGKNKS